MFLCQKMLWGQKMSLENNLRSQTFYWGFCFVISLVIYMDQFFTSISLSLNDRGFLEQMLFWYLDRAFKNQEI